MKFERSHEPIVWSMFGAGGMVAAFITPVLLLILAVLVPIGIIDIDMLSYDRVLAFTQSWIGKGIWLVVIALPLWHGMHRIHHGLHDLKVGVRNVSFAICYGFAAVVSVVVAVMLLMPT